MSASLRSRLKRGDLLIGTLVTLTSLESAEVLAEVGFDWLFVDLEHSLLGIREAQAIFQTVSHKIDCIVRVPLNDEIWIKKVLDSGAAGVLVPQVNTIEQARQVVRFSKYPPLGRRSVGVMRANGYNLPTTEYLEHANAETAVIIQVESFSAVENIHEIVAVDGIDAVFVGPYDLSASMGKTGEFDDPSVKAALESIRQACLAGGMPLGIFAATVDRAKAYIGEGFRLIAVSEDLLLMAQAAREVARALKD